MTANTNPTAAQPPQQAAAECPVCHVHPDSLMAKWTTCCREDCPALAPQAVSEPPAGVAGDEVVERAAFVAEAKRRGWTPGEFMLGAYAGWLASTLATPTHQAAEPLKPWRDAVEVLLLRPELADRARIEALLAGSLHQAAEPAASDKEAGIEYTLKNPAGVWSSYLVEKREHARCEAELRNCESRIREQRSEIKRLAASSEPAQPAASDMVLAPREPTEEIELAGEKALLAEFGRASRETWADVCGRVYRAMIAAAVPSAAHEAVPVPEAMEVGEDTKRDAARYRWLRNEALDFASEDGSPWAVQGLGAEDATPCYGDFLDRAIDAARAQQSKGPQA